MKIPQELTDYQLELFYIMLDDYGSEYKRCKDCSKPTHKRYTCSHCGSYDP